MEMTQHASGSVSDGFIATHERLRISGPTSDGTASSTQGCKEESAVTPKASYTSMLSGGAGSSQASTLRGGQSVQRHTLIPDSLSNHGSAASVSTVVAIPCTADIEKQQDLNLPPKQQRPILRNIRHKLWAVYERLFTFVFVANAAVFIWYCYKHANSTDLRTLSTTAVPIAVNLFATLLFRTEYWINVLYTLVIYTPHSIPLSIRRRLAKVYEFGGVHSGAGVSASLWAFFFIVQITRAFISGEPHLGVESVVFTYLLVGLLIAIIVAAHPAIRRAQHNYFEIIHRFCGWTALAFFWILSMTLSHSSAQALGEPMAKVVFTSPVVYFLLAATFLTILPWLRLRRLPCYAEKLSDHAVRLYLPAPRMGPVEGVRISKRPLLEWHSFAAIPCGTAISPPTSLLPTATTMVPGPKYSVLVSRAGDWTSEAIGAAGRPGGAMTSYWIRGAPVRGVALVVRLFRRAVIVTTGSGIGPALSMLAGKDSVPCRLVWSAKDPAATYGDTVMHEVRSADPDAVVWDTKQSGRPDMLELAWKAYRDFDAEAVVCISNPALTAQVVYGMESRGVPAYGPVFDS